MPGPKSKFARYEKRALEVCKKTLKISSSSTESAQEVIHMLHRSCSGVQRGDQALMKWVKNLTKKFVHHINVCKTWFKS